MENIRVNYSKKKSHLNVQQIVLLNACVMCIYGMGSDSHFDRSKGVCNQSVDARTIGVYGRGKGNFSGKQHDAVTLRNVPCNLSCNPLRDKLHGTLHIAFTVGNELV